MRLWLITWIVASCVPVGFWKFLQIQDKKKRLGSALTFLAHYSDEGDKVLNKIVTGDETLVCHVTSESKHQSIEWRHSQSSKNISSKQLCRKENSCALWCRTERAFCSLIFYPEGKQSMRKNIEQHWENFGMRFRTKCLVKILYRSMTTHVTILLVQLKTLFKKLVGSSLVDSPNLLPSDYYLFLHLKRDFGRHCFDSDDDAEDGVWQWLSSITASFYEESIDKLVLCYDKYLKNSGN